MDGYKPLSQYYVPTELYPAAYWPALDTKHDDWLNGARAVIAQTTCKTLGTAGFWEKAFCAAQGQPPPAVYYGWSRGRDASTRDVSPLAQGAVSAANAHLPIVEMTYPSADRIAAERWISPSSGAASLSRSATRPAAIPPRRRPQGRERDPIGFQSDLGWYLPPQLAGCSAERLWPLRRPTFGHVVNVVGFSISGTAASPDPVNSYFVLQNNWGQSRVQELPHDELRGLPLPRLRGPRLPHPA